MTSITPLFGICIKSGEIINQIIGTKHEIVPGDLLKIIPVKKGDNSDHYVIKLFDRINKSFGKELYQCEKVNLTKLDNSIFTYVSQLEIGADVAANLEIPGNKIKVNFRIKSFCDVPSLGAGRFLVLDIIDTPNLTEDNKFNLRMKYFFSPEAAYCFRFDRLIENLIVDNRPIIQPGLNQDNNQPRFKNDQYENCTPPQKVQFDKPHTSTPTNSNSQTINVCEASLIDFDDVSQINHPLKTFIVPPVTTNLNQTAVGFRNDNNMIIEPQLQNLKNGLSDLRKLTEKEHNGMNEYALTNPTNLISQNLYTQNDNIQKCNLVSATGYSTPPSETYYRDMANNPQIIKDFRASSIDGMSNSNTNIVPDNIRRRIEGALNPNDNSSVQGHLKQFSLPTVAQDDQVNVSVQMANISIKNQTPSNFLRKTSPPKISQNMQRNASPPPNIRQYMQRNASPPPKIPITKKPKPKKPRRKFNQNHNNSMTRCYICQNGGKTIQLDCQHVFCLECLFDLLKNLENACCPFKNGNYYCNNKLDVEDINNILDEVNESMTQPNINTTKTFPKTIIPEPKPAVKNIEDQFYVNDDDNSSEVIFNCKQDKCNGIWFVDKTEGRNTYMCPVCGTYNCFKCQVVHENMTCEEYNQYNPNWQNNSKGEPRRQVNYDDTIANELSWKCDHCTYNENLLDTAICVICGRTNDNLTNVNTIKSSGTEYYRLLQLEENDNFIPNYVEFECIICADTIQPDGGIQLRGCLHNFCHDCIRRYIENEDKAEIACPFDGCTNLLEDREIKSLVSPQAYARHLEISLRIGKTQIKNGYQCCVPNCQGWWIFIDGTYEYNCPVCHTINCITCKASHPAIDCKTYQQNLFYSTDKNGIETRNRLQQMLQTGEAEHCPKCNIIVVKNGGCAHMKCSMCRFDFNWGENRLKNLNIK